MIVIDEPEVYLHPDMQRKLLHVLKASGADIVVATHSTEIIAAADSHEVVVIDKRKSRAVRQDPSVTGTRRTKDIEVIWRAIHSLRGEFESHRSSISPFVKRWSATSVESAAEEFEEKLPKLPISEDRSYGLTEMSQATMLNASIENLEETSTEQFSNYNEDDLAAGIKYIAEMQERSANERRAKRLAAQVRAKSKVTPPKQ